MADSRMLRPDDVAVVIPALNEALRLQQGKGAVLLRPDHHDLHSGVGAETEAVGQRLAQMRRFDVGKLVAERLLEGGERCLA